MPVIAELEKIGICKESSMAETILWDFESLRSHPNPFWQFKNKCKKKIGR